MSDKIIKEGSSYTKPDPTPPKESAIEKVSREVRNAGYELIKKDDYERFVNESKGLKFIGENEYARLKQKQVGWLKKGYDFISELCSKNSTKEIQNKFTYITKDEYERLTKTKGFLAKIHDELPRAILNLVVAGIIAAFSFGYAKSKLSLKQYVENVAKTAVKDELNNPQPPSITTPQK